MLNRLAIIAANRLRLDAGVSHGLRAVAAGRAAGDDQALAAGLDGLTMAYLSLGDTHALAGVLVELKPLLRRLGDLFRLPWAEFEGGFLAIALADWDHALAAIGRLSSSTARPATHTRRPGTRPTWAGSRGCAATRRKP
jgi:hypothetical protein